MTLRELINDYRVELDEEVRITEGLLSSNVEVNYYWSHHMMPNQWRKQIEYVLHTHMYDDFEGLSEELNSDEICYLPQTASIFVNDEHVGILHLCDEENFKMITYSECECG